MLTAGDATVNQRDTDPALMEFIVWWGDIPYTETQQSKINGRSAMMDINKQDTVREDTEALIHIRLSEKTSLIRRQIGWDLKNGRGKEYQK